MALYKRGTTWWMSFNLNSKHIQKSTQCKNKRDAETVERAYRTQLAKGEVGLEVKTKAPQFVEAMGDFLAYVESEHRSKPNTVRSYKATSRALSSFFGNKRIDEIVREDVIKYKQTRSSQKCRPRTEFAKKKPDDVSKASDNKREPKILKPATINRELAVLKIFFNYYITDKRYSLAIQ